MSATAASRTRPTQAERSARTRSALLESAARGLSRYGYGNLVLEDVAREAGYTRGAPYPQFRAKEDLARAGLPARAVALALNGALEGAAIPLAGQAPHDELLAVRVVAGGLGLDRSRC